MSANGLPSTPAHPSPRRRVLQLAILSLIAVFWAWYLLRIWDELSAFRWQWSPAPIMGAIALWWLYTLGQALGWVFLNRAIGGQVSTRSGARIWLFSMPARYVPGNVWHVLSRMYLGSQAGLEASTVLLSSTIEQGMMVIAPLLVFLLSLVAWADRVDSRFVLLGLLFPIGLICLHPRVLAPLVRLAARLFRRPVPTVELRYAPMLALVGWYSVLHLASSLACYLVVVSLTPVPLDEMAAVFGAYALAYVVGYLSFLTPTGLGVREAALLGLLSLLLPTPVAAVAALLSRALSSVGELACILMLGYCLHPRRARRGASGSCGSGAA